MQHSNNSILLNDILKLENLQNVKIRFNKMFDGHWDPIDFYKNADFDALLRGQYWNYPKRRSYKKGDITIGFIWLNDGNSWLLFHIGRVTKDLDIRDGIGYEYETLTEYEKYFGRLIINFKNKSQMLVRLANSVISQCEIRQILPDIFDNDLFPGYDKVNLTWSELSRVIEKDSWKTALENQKGVYLISDESNGKMYVGSAYGEHMILGRWKSYIRNGNGGNTDFKTLSFDHIKRNFRYSILDTFNSKVDDSKIIHRENWWKETLQTRQFGYNKN